MFTRRHLSSSLRPCLRSLSRPLASTSSAVQRRGISSTLSRKAEEPAQDPAPVESAEEAPVEVTDEDLLSQPEGDSSAAPTSYREFMEKMGHKFQFASPGNYLGQTPFPMNPSFKPPPPISNEQKEVIYRLYLNNPLENSVRLLSKRFNLSLKRVNAIIRLKILEDRLKLQNGLQTGFQVGMERLLGAQTHSSIPAIMQNMLATEQWLNKALKDAGKDVGTAVDSSDPSSPAFIPPDVDEGRSDVHKADMLEQEEQRDLSASHYERLYWESVQEDGREPLLPSILQTERQKAELRKLNAEIKASKQFLVRRPHAPFIRRPRQGAFVVGQPRGRKGPTTKFVDVGGQFMDLDDRIKSLGISTHRSAMRRQKTEVRKERQ